MIAAGCVALLALLNAPVSAAAPAPWFADKVGGATQVLSVVGTGGSDANLDVWQRTAAGWQPVGTGIPAKIGASGMVPQSREGAMATPMGFFSLPFAFGAAPSPGGGLPYVHVDPDHWWDGDVKSPTYNSMQVCKKADCPFNTDSPSENLDIPQYTHAVVMGVNAQRVPGAGSAFFLHTSDGTPTAGCVSINDATLVKIIRWLQPGAVIAVAK
jgi:L,D-peptidoglycan transpeptidase YkuD (ErfK/YbiS/YcfS/YnhG family)